MRGTTSWKMKLEWNVILIKDGHWVMNTWAAYKWIIVCAHYTRVGKLHCTTLKQFKVEIARSRVEIRKIGKWKFVHIYTSPTTSGTDYVPVQCRKSLGTEFIHAWVGIKCPDKYRSRTLVNIDKLEHAKMDKFAHTHTQIVNIKNRPPVK